MSEITRGVPDAVQEKAKIIDFAATKARRLESPAGFANRTVFETPETPAKVLRPLSAGESNVIDFQAEREKRQSRFQPELIKQSVANDYEGTKPDISAKNEEQIALQEIRAKLARLEASSVRQQSAMEIEEIAAFRKNLLEKLNEKQAAVREESKGGSFTELLLGLLKDLMTGKTDKNQDTQDAQA